MQFSILDVVLVALFLAAAIIGGALGVLSKELVAAIITAAVAFLAARGKALFDKNKAAERKADGQRAEDRADKKDADEREIADGAPEKPLDASNSQKITIAPNGTVTVERLFEEPSDPHQLPDEHKIVDPKPKDEE